MATKKKAPEAKEQPTLHPPKVKQKIIRIHPMGLVGLLTENNRIGIKKGIQAGTQYVGGGYDAATNTFFIHVANERFDEISIGDRLPNLEIELEDISNLVEPTVDNEPTDPEAK